MCTNLLSEILIVKIKTDQNKFYHFHPVTEMTGHSQEGTFRTIKLCHLKYTRPKVTNL